MCDVLQAALDLDEEGVRPVIKEILLAKMRPGQSIELEAHCTKGACSATSTKDTKTATATPLHGQTCAFYLLMLCVRGYGNIFSVVATAPTQASARIMQNGRRWPPRGTGSTPKSFCSKCAATTAMAHMAAYTYAMEACCETSASGPQCRLDNFHQRLPDCVVWFRL